MQPRPYDRRDTSHAQRPLTLTPMEKLDLAELSAEIDRVNRMIAFQTANGQATQALYAYRTSLQNEFERISMYDPALLPVPMARPIYDRRRIHGVDSLLAHNRNQPFLYEQMTGFSPDETRLLLSKNVMGTNDFAIPKRGSLCPEALLVLVLCRLRSTTQHLDHMGEVFGVDAGFISDFFEVGLNYLAENHLHRLELDNLSKWAPRLEKYCDAFVDHFNARMGGGYATLPQPRFAGCNCTLDGTHFTICDPGDDTYYSGYVGDYNVGVLGITGACGMTMALSPVYAGSANDPGMAIDCDLNRKLHDASPGPVHPPMRALCDAIFGLASNISPLPKSNIVHPYTKGELATLSSIRVSVEWNFCEFKMEMFHMNQQYKQKVNQTLPALIIRCAFFLRNLKRTLRGCNATTYFGVYPPTLDEYLAM